ncbi:MAG: hypothetical protein M1840_002411 [Geoglossum simile]|nr:MAG: hypothetical protein M1840_002411 [Geoglossum simile]
MTSPTTPTRRQQTEEDDDVLLSIHMQRSSISDSLTPTADSETTPRNKPSPGSPGHVRTRSRGAFLRLPPDNSAFDAFVTIRADDTLTDKQAFSDFVERYHTTLTMVAGVPSMKLPVSFSNVKFKDIAPRVWLDPHAFGRDIKELEIFRSRLPVGVFRTIFEDVQKVSIQYGRMVSHENEEARSRFIAAIFAEIVCLFGCTVINKPERLLDSDVTKKGRIEHHFYALNSISIVFIEVKKEMFAGTAQLDVVAQVLAECAACDYENSKYDLWVPVLAILCNGLSFEYLVYDSGTKSIYSSGMVTGVLDLHGKPELFLPSLKETTERIFDYFLMAYTNAIRAFGDQSQKTASQSKRKRQSTDSWMDALAGVEHAHYLCREGTTLARESKYFEAEEYAIKGISKLRESVAKVPKLPRVATEPYVWDEEVALEA